MSSDEVKKLNVVNNLPVNLYEHKIFCHKINSGEIAWNLPELKKDADCSVKRNNG